MLNSSNNSVQGYKESKGIKMYYDNEKMTRASEQEGNRDYPV